MAGDWIKVEKSTLRKPEVAAIARLLGIKRREAIGLLLEFWVWLDDVCVDGVVDACVDADVDAMFEVGFAATLSTVGWAVFEADKNGLTGRMLIPNAARHFGESSKNRALKNERQARWRAKHVDGHVDAPPSTKASTREEKRREDIKPKSTPLAKKLSTPTPEHRELARQQSVDCDVEFGKFSDYIAANGKRWKDENAAFRNWLRNAKSFAPAKPVLPSTGSAAHLPARLPILEPHSEMPAGVRDQLAAVIGKLTRVA